MCACGGGALGFCGTVDRRRTCTYGCALVALGRTDGVRCILVGVGGSSGNGR